MKWRLDDGQIEVVDEAVADILRRKTPAERMRMVAEAWEFARLWVRAGVRSQHPDWGDERVADEVKRRFLHAAG